MKYLLTIGTFFLFTFTSGLYAQTRHLNHYINSSLENSPLLKDYQNQKMLNRMDSLIAKAAYRPLVNFSSNNFWAPIVSGVGYDEAITHKGRNNALLTVRQTIVGQGNLKTRLNTYSLENQSVENVQKISVQN